MSTPSVSSSSFVRFGIVFSLTQMIAGLSIAWAAESSTALFPQKQLCAPPQQTNATKDLSVAPSSTLVDVGQTVAPQAIIAQLLNRHYIRQQALDANGDGNTLLEEKILALTDDNFCTSLSTHCSRDDEAALATAREQLRSFAEQRGGPGYIIERLDQDGEASAQDQEIIDLRELLDPDSETFEIRCIALSDHAQQEIDEQDASYWHEKDQGGFRLTGEIDNLGKSRGSLGAVKVAELSITGDLIEDETAYRVNAVTGYAFDIAGGDDLQTLVIPFVLAERVTSGDETQIDTFGAGIQQTATLEWPGTLISEFAVTPVYTTDSDFESQTGTLKFRWTPTLAAKTGLPLGFPRVYGPIELRLGLDLLADAGRVFDEGDQGNLEGEGNFLRLGSQASMQVRGAPDNLLRQFEIQLTNRYLHNVDTTFDDINQFDAALAYLFPGSENYQLSIAYSNGRDENSLELYEFWQTQFGIRF